MTLRELVRFIRLLPSRVPGKFSRWRRNLQGKPRPGYAADDFDQRTGMDTATPVKIYKLDSINGSYVHGQGYATLSAAAFQGAIELLPTSCRNYAFYDLGSGKGKAAFLANDAGFQSVIGVELSPMLVNIANSNRQKWPRPDEFRFVLADASQFVFEDRNSIVFLYHPFDALVTRKVVANIEKSFSNSEVWVVYVSPLHRKCFEGWNLYAEKGMRW